MKRALVSKLLLLLCAAFLAGSRCDDERRVFAFFSDAEWATVQSLAGLSVPPADTTNSFANHPGAAELGRKYFFDTRFSGPLTHIANDPGTNPGFANGSVGEVQKVSCARCHNPATGFSDQATVPDNTSLGAAFTGRHAPTLYNVDHNDWYFWDGRKDSLWSQALGPTESAVEHNGNRVHFAMVIRDLYADGVVTPGGTDHDDVFGLLPAELDDLGTTYPFPDPADGPDFETQGRPGDSGDPGAGAFATYDGLPAGHKQAVNLVFSHFGKALQAYQRRITSVNSDFDKFVAGQPSGFSAAAQRGLKLFIGKAKCVECHSGRNFSDNLFHNIGVNQFAPNVPPVDNGRIDGIPTVLADPFNGEGAFSDDPAAGTAKLDSIRPLPPPASAQGAFKTPTLRSINETGPYMHTGQFKTLASVMSFYNRGGDLGPNELVPLGLSQGEMDDIVAFMLTLEGEELPSTVTDLPDLP